MKTNRLVKLRQQNPEALARTTIVQASHKLHKERRRNKLSKAYKRPVNAGRTIGVSELQNLALPRSVVEAANLAGKVIILVINSNGETELGFIDQQISINLLPKLGTFYVEPILDRKQVKEPLQIYPGILDETYNWKSRTNYNIKFDVMLSPVPAAEDKIESDFLITEEDNELATTYGLAFGFDYKKRPKINLVQIFSDERLPHKLLSLAVILQEKETCILSNRSQRPRRNLPNNTCLRQYYYDYKISEPAPLYDICFEDHQKAIITYKAVLKDHFPLFQQLAQQLLNKTAWQLPKQKDLTKIVSIESDFITEPIEKTLAAMPKIYKEFLDSKSVTSAALALERYTSKRITPGLIISLVAKARSIFFALYAQMQTNLITLEIRRIAIETFKLYHIATARWKGHLFSMVTG